MSSESVQVLRTLSRAGKYDSDDDDTDDDDNNDDYDYAMTIANDDYPKSRIVSNTKCATMMV